MFGWVETRMGPGANERSNGFFARRLIGVITLVGGMIAGGIVVSAGFIVVTVARATPFAIARATAFTPTFAARRTIATPFAAAFAVSRRRAIGTAAFESRRSRRPVRRAWRVRHVFLDEVR
jgi:hypothetical protein